jgi:hypothetical protein
MRSIHLRVDLQMTSVLNSSVGEVRGFEPRPIDGTRKDGACFRSIDSGERRLAPIGETMRRHDMCSPPGTRASAGRRWALALLLVWAPVDQCFPVDTGLPGEASDPPPAAETYTGNLTVRSVTPQSTDAPVEESKRPPGGAAGAAATTQTEPPSSVDELFGTGEQSEGSSTPESAGELFGVEQPAGPRSKLWSGRFTGFVQNELAYTYPEPAHFSTAKTILRLSTEGRLSDRVKWRAGAHLAYDPVYTLSDFYPDRVKDNQQFDAYAYETYLDASAGPWDFRLGRQNVIWGEAVGLFVADVVSALDLREFVLPEFDLIRIPQWAMRAEYFQGDFHGEALWIPFMTYDDIGKAGADFFPYPPPPPPGFGAVFKGEKTPSNSPSNSAGGVRLSLLKGGWDTALFYYTSMDREPAFERSIVSTPEPAFVYRPIHNRIHQVGATVGKDLGPTVLSIESVYTLDRLFSVTRVSDADGLVHQNVLNYLVGLDYVFGRHDLDFQFYQLYFPDHDPDMVPDRVDSGFTVRASTSALGPDLEPEVLWLYGLNRNDWLLETKLKWTFHRQWQAVLGLDVFQGPQETIFGQYDANDRVYYQVRYTF